MINARLSFPTSETVVDLSKPLYELQSQLRKANVLTHPNNITLDNSRMLKVELFAEDSTGENILDLVDTDSDTLGTVNKLCSLIRKMDYRDDKVFSDKLASGRYTTLTDAICAAEKLNEARRIENKKQEQVR